MNIKYLFALAVMILMLTGCASTGESKQRQVERITPEELAKLLPPAVATVSLDEIVTDSKQGKSADEIIARIEKSNSRYELTPTRMLDLSKQGVDTKVLEHIQQSNELAKQNAIADEINRREKEKAEVQKQLRNERALSRNRYYSPWGPRFGLFYGHGHRYRHGPRHGWGLRYGYPYGW